MRYRFLLFFCIALISELSTTWLQRLLSVRDVERGLYYPDLGSLFVKRLLVWLLIFLLLWAILWPTIGRRISDK